MKIHEICGGGEKSRSGRRKKASGGGKSGPGRDVVPGPATHEALKAGEKNIHLASTEISAF